MSKHVKVSHKSLNQIIQIKCISFKKETKLITQNITTNYEIENALTIFMSQALAGRMITTSDGIHKIPISSSFI
jgi:hypothetical protein